MSTVDLQLLNWFTSDRSNTFATLYFDKISILQQLISILDF